MIVLSLSNEEIVSDVEEKTEQEIKDESVFYVEKATGFIYEVKLFQDYAMVRPATPEASANIFRLGIMEFARKYTEYQGDSQAIRDYLWGEEMPDRIVIDRRK